MNKNNHDSDPPVTPSRSGDDAKTARRDFLRDAAGAIAGVGVLAGMGALAGCGLPTQKKRAEKLASFPTADYDWTKHRWAYGIDPNSNL